MKKKELDDVENAKVTSVGENTVQIDFDPPTGYYSGVAVICYPEDSSNSAEINNVGKGITQIGCYFLVAGSTVSLVVFAYKGANINADDTVFSDGVYFSVNTSKRHWLFGESLFSPQ